MTQQTALVSEFTTSTSSQDTRRQTVARLLGAQSFASIHWRHLLQDGTLVHLRIGRCRFSTRLLLEEMGIQIEDPTVADKLSRWTTLVHLGRNIFEINQRR